MKKEQLDKINELVHKLDCVRTLFSLMINGVITGTALAVYRDNLKAELKELGYEE